jgi:hypothetical protein
VLQQAVAASPETAVQAGIDCIRQCLHDIADAADRTWAELGELIWGASRARQVVTRPSGKAVA